MHRRIKWSAGALVVIALVLVLISISDEVDWRGLRQALEQMDRLPLFALAAVLPLFGFSIGIVYLAVGAVFGVEEGIAVVAVITAGHLVGSHWIGRSFLREPLRRFLQRRKHRLPEVPEGRDASVALMAALVPGLPYFARNYLLALSDLPLRSYFWICWPIYVVRSGVVILFGDFSDDFSASRIAILSGILALKIAVCAYLWHRVRTRPARQARRAASA